MNDNDVKVIKGPGPVMEFVVASGAAASIGPGEPVKKSTNAVVLLATGDPEVGTDEFVGIAANTSTDTASADGVVLVTQMIPTLTTMRCDPTTTTNANTAAKVAGLIGDFVCFDLTSTVFTVDEDETDDPNVHGLRIIGGDHNSPQYLDFIAHILATSYAPLVGQTMD